MLRGLRHSGRFVVPVFCVRTSLLSGERFYSSNAAKCLVLAEHNNEQLNPITLNVITAAKQISNDVTVLVLGSNCQSVVDETSTVEGVSSVIYNDQENFFRLLPESVAPVLESCQKEHSFSHILAPAAANGKNILPRLGASLDSQPISDVIKIESVDTFVRPIYAGNALSTVQSEDSIKILTVRPTSFEAAKASSNSAPTTKIDVTVDQTLSTWKSEELQKSERPELTAAKVIVTGGRGMKSGDNFAMLEKLADTLGAAVGATRAAVDDGMVPNDMQIGQTGKVVAPELYMAFGVSGAIQHIAGMKESKVIVVVNKDEEAPFFQIADYGLVGDLFTVVPELTEKLAARKK